MCLDIANVVCMRLNQEIVLIEIRNEVQFKLFSAVQILGTPPKTEFVTSTIICF